MDNEIRPITRHDLESAGRRQLIEYLEAHGSVQAARHATENLRTVALSEFDMALEVTA